MMVISEQNKYSRPVPNVLTYLVGFPVGSQILLIKTWMAKV